MKKTNIFKGLAMVVLAGSIASCSDNYLTLEPEASIQNEDATGDAGALKASVFGICQSMYKQYSGLYDYRWFNGEPWLAMFYGDVAGQDYNSLFWMQSDRGVTDWTRMGLQNSTATFVAWSYCYGIINQCNQIISAIDGKIAADIEIDADSMFRYAQAKTMRAHAYTRLLQIYGPRWADSQNGAVETVVLRTAPADINGDYGASLAPMNDILKLIYEDLGNALEIYESCGKGRMNIWEPDADIARGLFARAALLKDDWQTAQIMAHDARQGWGIMSADEYTAGFAEPTSEWMWSNSPSPVGMYFSSFGASYACNGAYPVRWGTIGAGAINYDLYREMDPNDIRTDLFFTPDKVPAQYQSLFWNSTYCTSSTMDINKFGRNENGEPVYGPLAYCLQQLCDYNYKRAGAAKGWPFPYATPGNGNFTYGVNAQFGTQFKFWAVDYYGSSSFPFMRASEMLLIEAEAACHNNDEATAKECLLELNEKRIEGYALPQVSGDALLEEVKLNRRIELWGEGFNWFDYKRWNEPIVRRAWEVNNPASNNIPASMAGTYDVDKQRGWRWVIPLGETQYNSHLTKLGENLK